MKPLKKMAAVLAFLGCAFLPAAHAYEGSAWVKVHSFYTFSNSNGSTTWRTYYIYAETPWGFANCSSAVNGNFIAFSSTDVSSKDWVAAVLLARATGGMIQVTISDCTNLVVVQVGYK